ncbi:MULTISPECIES: sulfotransferase family protein [Thermomonosporaceae]|uniref:sulfotransferase family protein n=1 Tax=Thermomonosporaceae TaxID=2012 RepID=UPI00255B0120|nr:MULTISPECIES: sulfotransferase family protein [Thermomonosporaceae]MDL4776977.1 sulfotransferase [Actinomadura xylanilytica]
MLEVIGAGFGRTGTLSMKAALERLGFGPCHHMLELVENSAQGDLWMPVARGEDVDWDVVFEGYRSCVDWPSAGYWRELSAAYPDAKMILTVRDPGKWWESVHDSIYQFTRRPAPPDPSGVYRSVRAIADKAVWEDTFGGRFADRAHAIGVFEEHTETVRREIPAERLLVFEVAQGWEPLCSFLGVPVPDEEFPRLNDRAAINAMMMERFDQA